MVEDANPLASKPRVFATTDNFLGLTKAQGFKNSKLYDCGIWMKMAWYLQCNGQLAVTESSQR